MNTISINYALKYQHKEYHYYQWTKDGECFNLKTGRQIKKVYNGGSLGYCINGKFVTLGKLREQIENIKLADCPF